MINAMHENEQGSGLRNHCGRCGAPLPAPELFTDRFITGTFGEVCRGCWEVVTAEPEQPTLDGLQPTADELVGAARRRLQAAQQRYGEATTKYAQAYSDMLAEQHKLDELQLRILAGEFDDRLPQ